MVTVRDGIMVMKSKWRWVFAFRTKPELVPGPIGVTPPELWGKLSITSRLGLGGNTGHQTLSLYPSGYKERWSSSSLFRSCLLSLTSQRWLYNPDLLLRNGKYGDHTLPSWHWHSITSIGRDRNSDSNVGMCSLLYMTTSNSMVKWNLIFRVLGLLPLHQK